MGASSTGVSPTAVLGNMLSEGPLPTDMEMENVAWQYPTEPGEMTI